MSRPNHVSKMPALKTFLEKKNFFFANNGLKHPGNNATWYAYRKSKLSSRECECNSHKGMQIVVYPYMYTVGNVESESVEIELVGEHNETWFKLSAYSMSPAELVRNLPALEASLIRAWNALEKPTKGEINVTTNKTLVMGSLI